MIMSLLRAWPVLNVRIKHRARPSAGKHTRRCSGFCSDPDPEPFTNGRGAQGLILNYWCKKVDLCTVLFINLTAAAICRRERRKNEEREPESPITVELCERWI